MAIAELRRILTVEDDDAVFANWQRALREYALLVRAPTLDAAWGLTNSAVWVREPCHYAFVDLRLPDGSGIDLLDRLASLQPCPRVAVLSGYLDAAQMLAVQGRCDIAVPKPADRDVLLGVLAVLEAARTGSDRIHEFARAHALSEQEERLLIAAINDADNVEAARLLCCSVSTVRTYWARILRKTGRRSTREVISYVFRFASARGAAIRR